MGTFANMDISQLGLFPTGTLANRGQLGHLPAGMFADRCLLMWMFVACRWDIFLLTRTFADGDICRWGCLPTGMFADWDVCQRGHLPMGTFANMDVVYQPGHFPTWTFPNLDISKPVHFPTRTFSNRNVCQQLSTGMFAYRDVCRWGCLPTEMFAICLWIFFCRQGRLLTGMFANMDICLPTWTFPNLDISQPGHFPTGIFPNRNVCQQGTTVTFAYREVCQRGHPEGK